MHTETELGSMKVLLKQVYGVHTTKVKCLEDKIEELKKSLQEATLKLKSYESSECKRCVELEEAFNSCKAALLEQSKMFENIGQKFSNFNPIESKTIQEKMLKIPENIGYESPSEPSVHVAPVKKMDLSTSSKTYFLKNLMSLNVDENLESLELSVPLQKSICQEYSSLNPDSLVLVPNTMEFGCEEAKISKKSSDKIGDAKIKNGYGKDLIDINKIDAAKTSECKVRKKRLSNDDSNLSNGKLNKENEISNENKKLKSSVTIEDNFTPIIKLENVPTSPKGKNSKSCADVYSNSNISKKNNTPALEIKICKIEEDDFVDESKNPYSENFSIGAIPQDDSFQVTVSPSLLPLKEKTNTKAVNNPPTMAEDINDFQIPTLNKKANNGGGGTWTSCDKKKLARKSSNLRHFKSTSRFKMQLDSLPPNFKKPTYRQTKLSQSIFQPKSTVDVKQEPDEECIEVDEKFEDFVKDLPLVSLDRPTVSSSTKTVDFDATCIPENYEYEIIPSNNVAPAKPKTGKPFPNSIMIVKDDSDSFESDSSSEMIIEQKPYTSKQDKSKDNLGSKPLDVGQLGNSFDRLPKKSEPDFKYKEETVRKKSERKNLVGFDCKECEKYYTDLGLSDEEKKQRMQKCSRHRSKFVPPPTPEHFWELEFPDTQECKARGYLNETQKVKLKTHRKRPL